MRINHYKKMLFGIAVGVASLLPIGTLRAEEAFPVAPNNAVPVRTTTYRSDALVPVQEVRWGRGYYGGVGYYGGPRGYYAPRYYSGYRGYGAPYGAYYPGRYYGARDGYGPGYGLGYGGYYGGGVRVGRLGVFWR